MNKKILLGFVFLFLFTSLVIGEPPFSENQVEGNLKIDYPPFIYYKQGGNITLNFHIYNSTAYPIFNDNISCNYHLYNQQGRHIQYGELLNLNIYDKYFIVNSSIQNNNILFYVLWCNNSKEAGYITGAFEITKDGLPNSIEQERTGLSLSVLLLFTFLMIISFMVGLGKIQVSENDIIKHFTKFVFRNMGFLFLWLLLGLFQKALEYTIYTSIMTGVYNISSYLIFAVIFADIILSMWSFIPYLIKLAFKWVGNK